MTRLILVLITLSFVNKKFQIIVIFILVLIFTSTLYCYLRFHCYTSLSLLRIFSFLFFSSMIRNLDKKLSKKAHLSSGKQKWTLSAQTASMTLNSPPSDDARQWQINHHQGRRGRQATNKTLAFLAGDSQRWREMRC